MPEPDFDQIALYIARRLDTEALDDADMAYNVNIVREQLRLVWNARGAADLTALEYIIGKLGDTMDPDNARVFVSDAIRTVDR